MPSIVISVLSSHIQCHRHYLSSLQPSHHSISTPQHLSLLIVIDIALHLLSLSDVLEDFNKSLPSLSTPHPESVLLSIKYKECIWIILWSHFTVSLDSIILVITFSYWMFCNLTTLYNVIILPPCCLAPLVFDLVVSTTEAFFLPVFLPLHCILLVFCDYLTCFQSMSSQQTVFMAFCCWPLDDLLMCTDPVIVPNNDDNQWNKHIMWLEQWQKIWGLGGYASWVKVIVPCIRTKIACLVNWSTTTRIDI